LALSELPNAGPLSGIVAQLPQEVWPSGVIASIANCEKRLAQARAELAHITAAITIFEGSGDVEEIPPYVDIHRCFKRGEAINFCKEALASGPLNIDTGDRYSPRPLQGVSFTRFASNAESADLGFASVT
jgi:hypothetical protein